MDKERYTEPIERNRGRSRVATPKSGIFKHRVR